MEFSIYYKKQQFMSKQQKKSFSFSQTTVNIFDLKGKDLDFLDTPIYEKAQKNQNNQATIAFMEDLAKNATELVDEVIKSTDKLVAKGEHNQVEVSYLAGFLDGDGTINVSTTKTSKDRGYVKPYKSQLNLSFIQKDRRRSFLEVIKASFGDVGLIRQKDSGVCEYNIYDEQVIVPLLKLLLPYLRVKKRQAALAILFTTYQKKNLPNVDYLKRAMLVDVLCSYNDSKNHKNNAKVIRDQLIADNLLSAEEIKLTDFVI